MSYVKRLEKAQNEIRRLGLMPKARGFLGDADELERIIAEAKSKEVKHEA